MEQLTGDTYMSVLCKWLKSCQHGLRIEHGGKHCAHGSVAAVASEIVKWPENQHFLSSLCIKIHSKGRQQGMPTGPFGDFPALLDE